MGCSSCGGNVASQAIVRATSKKPKQIVSSISIASAVQRPKGTYASVKKIVR